MKSLIHVFLLLILIGCMPDYKVNEDVLGRIYVNEKYNKYSECLRKLAKNNGIDTSYAVGDSVKRLLKEQLSDIRSDRYISIEDSKIIFGVSSGFMKIYTVYSPVKLGVMYRNEYYYRGICTDTDKLSKYQKDFFRIKYENRFLDKIIHRCE